MEDVFSYFGMHMHTQMHARMNTHMHTCTQTHTHTHTHTHTRRHMYPDKEIFHILQYTQHTHTCKIKVHAHNIHTGEEEAS